MSLIKLLNETLINQIAAGEVIERPASVVKELTENSIDAGAKNISIELKDGGRTFIKVVDDGKGMSREDLQMAVKRHATSKISEESDLWKIHTMGFRGEALASIAAVSKMTIKSRRNDDQSGTRLDLQGGDSFTLQDTAMNSGTHLEIFDLFFNTPARQNYLKKDSTELGHITSLLDTMALANPSVALKLTHNGKVVFDYKRSTDLISRISDIFGNALVDAMIPIFYGGTEFQIEGFIGKPVVSRASSQHQYFFVNGRPIQHHVLAHTIKNAYHSMLMENRKPIFIINIKIDPALIDVNVHPRKLEIRFEDQQSVARVLYGATKTALEKTSLIPKGFTESQRYMADGFPLDGEKAVPGDNYGNTKERLTDWQNGDNSAIKYDAKMLGQENFGGTSMFAGGKDFGGEQSLGKIYGGRAQQQIFTETVVPKIKPIVQIANAYIVAENDEGLILIDQHAAHERVRFEQLMDQFEKQEKQVQRMLMPLQVQLSNEEVKIIEENLEIFEGLGFEVENFGGNTFMVNSVPSALAKENLEEIICGVLDDIAEMKGPSNMQGKIEQILTYMSCRSAIKFGQRLTLLEIEALIEQMEGLKRPFTCPHGRPTIVSLSVDELNKMFGRK